MTEDERPAFRVEDLEFSYGKLKVLDGLTLSVSTGEIFGVLGANGSGKTTLLRLLVGLLRPQLGMVRVLGEEPSPRLFIRRPGQALGPVKEPTVVGRLGVPVSASRVEVR